MSIFDKVKREAEKAGRTVKSAAEDAGHGIEDTAKSAVSGTERAAREAEKAGRTVKSAAEDAGHAIEDTAKSAVSGTERAAREAEKTGMDVGKEMAGLVNKAGKEITGLKDKALREIREAEKKAQGDVIATGREVGSGLEKTVTKQLPKLLATALSGIASEAMKPGLKGAAKLARNMGAEMDALAKEDPELVKAINQCGFRLKIKANVELILVYQQFYSRSRELAAILDRAGNDGIAFRRRDLIGFVEAMGPTTIALGAGAEVSLGFDLGGTASLTAIPLKLFTRLADRGLKELGVPE